MPRRGLLGTRPDFPVLNRQSPLANGLTAAFPLNGDLRNLVTGGTATYFDLATAPPLRHFESHPGKAMVCKVDSGADGQFVVCDTWFLNPTIWSLSLWFCWRTAGDSEAIIGTDGSFQWYASSSFTFQPFQSDNGTNAFTGFAPSVNVWTHVVLVRNDKTFTQYVNGKFDNSGTYASSFTINSPVAIGNSRYFSATGNAWQGGVADVFAWNRELSGREAWQLFDPASRFELYREKRRTYFVAGVAPVVTRTNRLALMGVA